MRVVRAVATVAGAALLWAITPVVDLWNALATWSQGRGHR
jgi:hypothetical protein